MKKVLMICLGNICRSPMAEFILKEEVRKRGLEGEVYVASAATSAYEIGNDTYAPARDMLTKKKVPFEKRAARQIVAEDYELYDYLIGMDEKNRADILSCMGGDPEGKIHLLLDFTEEPRDIFDPWFSGDFETCYRDLVEGIDAFLEEFTKE